MTVTVGGKRGWSNCFVGFALPPISKETAIDEWATLFFRNAFATI